MSQLIYNGIALQIVETESIERVPRMSDDGTTYRHTDFYITVRFIYNPFATSYSPTGRSEAGWLAPVTDAAIRHALLQPMKPLEYSEGGVTILSVAQNILGGAIDADNGPHPLECHVTKIKGPGYFQGYFSIRASVIECPSGTFISAISSARYSRRETLNVESLSTMTTSGTAYFRSNVLAALGQNADAFRGYIVPPLLAGYQRDSLDFSLAEDGLSLRFTVIDKERKVDLGDLTIPGTAGSIGITLMDFTYSISQPSSGTLGIAGYMSIANVDASATGMKGSSNFDILQFLFATALARLGDITTYGVLIDAAMVEDVMNASVKIRMSYMIVPPDTVAFPDMSMPIRGFVGAPILTLPATNGINPQPPFSKGTRGTAAYQLAVLAFGQACYMIDQDSFGRDGTGTVVPADAFNRSQPYGNSLQVSGFYEPFTSYPTTYRQRGLQNFRGPNPGKTVYTRYKLHSKYKTKGGKVQAPIATPPADSGGSPGGGSGGSLNGSLGGGGSPGGGGGGTDGTPTPTAVILQLYQPMTEKTFEWSIERIGCVPEVPSAQVPDNLAQVYSLMDYEVSPIGVELMPDGYTPVYRLTGSYTYAFFSGLPPDSAIPFDIPPWVGVGLSQFTEIVPLDYLQGIGNTTVV